MTFVASQIVIWIIAAVVLGFFLGGLAHSLHSKADKKTNAPSDTSTP